MCGIVGFTGKPAAAPILLDGLKKLEYRGYDSAGIAVQGDGGIRVVKTRGKVESLCEKAGDCSELGGSTGIGHTRWATHGMPTDENAHPHMSNDGKFAVVHNGIIENYAELREELKEKGFQFHSETDTEVVVHLLDMYYEGDLKEAALKTAAQLKGSWALGILCADQPGKLFAIRESSPLILGVGVGENFFASDVTALVSHTRNVVYLDDGESAELSPEGIQVFDCTGRPVEKTVTRVVGRGGGRKGRLRPLYAQGGSWSSPARSSPPSNPHPGRPRCTGRLRFVR
jgi:glucosamine--fructose-6-phosphate aminotransferase (isomerizing)